MRVLVVGGAASGKSAYAERLACTLSTTRTYVATMADSGAEARARIARHREQRAHLGFFTVECTDTLPARPASPAAARGVALLEDVGNLAANALFAPDGSMGDPHDVCDLLEREVRALAEAYRHLVVVSNEVGCEGRSAWDSTHAWVRLVGTLNARIAQAFDVVIEVVAGIPVAVKGDLP